MSSPIITNFTSQCACQNRLNSDRSEELRPGIGKSVGFMGTLSVAQLHSPELKLPDWGRAPPRGPERTRRAVCPAPPTSQDAKKSSRPPPATVRIPLQRVQ